MKGEKMRFNERQKKISHIFMYLCMVFYRDLYNHTSQICPKIKYHTFVHIELGTCT